MAAEEYYDDWEYEYEYEPEYEEPSYEEPYYEEPVYEQPYGYEEPYYGEPYAYEEPSYETYGGDGYGDERIAYDRNGYVSDVSYGYGPEVAEGDNSQAAWESFLAGWEGGGAARQWRDDSAYDQRITADTDADTDWIDGGDQGVPVGELDPSSPVSVWADGTPMDAKAAKQARVYQVSLEEGLDDEGARAMVAVTETEGGLFGARGDNGQSRGPFQFYEKGQMPAFRRWLAEEGIQGDPNVLVNDVELATRFAARNYLGTTIRRGQQQGIHGAELATYAQRHGQVSINPEKSGSNYQRLFAQGDPYGEALRFAVPDRATRRGRAAQIPPGHADGDGHDHGVSTPYATQQVDKAGNVWTIAFDYDQPYDNPFNPAIPRHRGVDLQPTGVPNGGMSLPYTAFRSGRVAKITNDPHGGIGIIVDTGDPNARYDRYFHNNAVSVREGDQVVAGQTSLGLIGQTGSEGFPHLHYEVSRNIDGDPVDQTIDPRQFLGWPSPQQPRPQATPRLLDLPTPYTSGRRPRTTGVIVHSTRGQGATPQDEFDWTLRWFRENPYQVSANAVIGPDGTIAMPKDWDAATHHAGEHNRTHFGIELAQSAADAAAGVPFTDAQYQSLGWLLQQVSQRYGLPITRQTVIGHEESAQGQRVGKTDPGPNFDWGQAIALGNQQAPRVAQVRTQQTRVARPVAGTQDEYWEPRDAGQPTQPAQPTSTYTVAGRPATQAQYEEAVQRQQAARQEFLGSLPEDTRNAFTEWETFRKARGEDPTNLPEFRAHLGRLGAPDPWTQREEAARAADARVQQAAVQQRAAQQAAAQRAAQPAQPAQTRTVYRLGEREITEAEYNELQAHNARVAEFHARADREQAELDAYGRRYQQWAADAQADPYGIGPEPVRPETPTLNQRLQGRAPEHLGAATAQITRIQSPARAAAIEDEWALRDVQQGQAAAAASGRFVTQRNAEYAAQEAYDRDVALLQAARAHELQQTSLTQEAPSALHPTYNDPTAGGTIATPILPSSVAAPIDPQTGQPLAPPGSPYEQWPTEPRIEPTATAVPLPPQTADEMAAALGARPRVRADAERIAEAQAEYDRSIQEIRRAVEEQARTDKVSPRLLEILERDEARRAQAEGRAPQPITVTIPGTPEQFDVKTYHQLLAEGAEPEEARRAATIPGTPSREMSLERPAQRGPIVDEAVREELMANGLSSKRATELATRYPERPAWLAPYDTRIEPEIAPTTAVGHALGRGFSGLGTGMLEFGEMAADQLGVAGTADALRQGRYSAEADRRALNLDVRSSAEAFDSPLAAVETLSEMTAYVAPSLLTGLAGTGAIAGTALGVRGAAGLLRGAAGVSRVGLAVNGMAAAGQMHQELADEVARGELSQGAANTIAVGAGLAEVLVERFTPGIDQMLLRGLGDDVARHFTAEVKRRGIAHAIGTGLAGEAVQEGLEEVITESYNVAINQAVSGKKLELGEAIEQLGTAAVLGALMGGTISAPVVGATAFAESRERARQEVFQALVGEWESSQPFNLVTPSLPGYADRGAPAFRPIDGVRAPFEILADEGFKVGLAAPDSSAFIVQQRTPDGLGRTFVLSLTPQGTIVSRDWNGEQPVAPSLESRQDEVRAISRFNAAMANLVGRGVLTDRTRNGAVDSYGQYIAQAMEQARAGVAQAARTYDLPADRERYERRRAGYRETMLQEYRDANNGQEPPAIQGYRRWAQQYHQQHGQAPPIQTWWRALEGAFTLPADAFVPPNSWTDLGGVPGSDVAYVVGNHVPTDLAQAVRDDEVLSGMTAMVSRGVDDADRVVQGAGVVPRSAGRRNLVAGSEPRVVAYNDNRGARDPVTGVRTQGQVFVNMGGVLVDALKDFGEELVPAWVAGVDGQPIRVMRPRKDVIRSQGGDPFSLMNDPDYPKFVAAKLAETIGHEPAHEAEEGHNEVHTMLLDGYVSGLAGHVEAILPVVRQWQREGKLTTALAKYARLLTATETEGAADGWHGYATDLLAAIEGDVAGRAGRDVSGTGGVADEGRAGGQPAPGAVVSAVGGTGRPGPTGGAELRPAALAGQPATAAVAGVPALGPPGTAAAVVEEQARRVEPGAAPSPLEAQPPSDIAPPAIVRTDERGRPPGMPEVVFPRHVIAPRLGAAPALAGVEPPPFAGPPLLSDEDAIDQGWAGIPDPRQPIRDRIDLHNRLATTPFISQRELVEILGERPEDLQQVVEFMLDQRAKVTEGRLLPSDVAKAYLMTVSSQGQGAVSAELIRDRTGLTIPDHFLTPGVDGTRQIRPEDAAAAWIASPNGQRALAALDRGEYDAAAWAEAAAIRHAFSDDRITNLNVLGTRPNRPGRLSMREVPALTAGLNRLSGDPRRLSDAVARLNGIGPQKVGFIQHLLGFGQTPTIDARVINAWMTGRGDIRGITTPEAENARVFNQHRFNTPMVFTTIARIIAGYNQLRRSGFAPDIPGAVYNAVIHGWLWSKIKGQDRMFGPMHGAMAAPVQDPGGRFIPLSRLLPPGAPWEGAPPTTQERLAARAALAERQGERADEAALDALYGEDRDRAPGWAARQWEAEGAPSAFDEAAPSPMVSKAASLLLPVPIRTEYSEAFREALANSVEEEGPYRDLAPYIDPEYGLVLPTAARGQGMWEADRRAVRGGLYIRAWRGYGTMYEGQFADRNIGYVPRAEGPAHVVREHVVRNPLLYWGGSVLIDHANQLAMVMGADREAAQGYVRFVWEALQRDGPEVATVEAIIRDMGMGDPSLAPLLVVAANGEIGSRKGGLTDLIITSILGFEGRARGYDGVVSWYDRLPRGRTVPPRLTEALSFVVYSNPSGRSARRGESAIEPGFWSHLAGTPVGNDLVRRWELQQRLDPNDPSMLDELDEIESRLYEHPLGRQALAFTVRDEWLYWDNPKERHFGETGYAIIDGQPTDMRLTQAQQARGYTVEQGRIVYRGDVPSDPWAEEPGWAGQRQGPAREAPPRPSRAERVPAAILEALGDEELGPTEIGRRIGSPPAVVSRALADLVQQGQVERRSDPPNVRYGVAGRVPVGPTAREQDAARAAGVLARSAVRPTEQILRAVWDTLGDETLTSTDIGLRVGYAASGISSALSYLRAAGLVTSARRPGTKYVEHRRAEGATPDAFLEALAPPEQAPVTATTTEALLRQPQRLAIAEALADGPVAGPALVASLPIGPSTAYFHVQNMAEDGLLEVTPGRGRTPSQIALTDLGRATLAAYVSPDQDPRIAALPSRLSTAQGPVSRADIQRAYDLLADGPLAVGDLASALGWTNYGRAGDMLRAMEQNGLAQGRTEGRQRVYERVEAPAATAEARPPRPPRPDPRWWDWPVPARRYWPPQQEQRFTYLVRGGQRRDVAMLLAAGPRTSEELLAEWRYPDPLLAETLQAMARDRLVEINGPVATLTDRGRRAMDALAWQRAETRRVQQAQQVEATPSAMAATPPDADPRGPNPAFPHGLWSDQMQTESARRAMEEKVAPQGGWAGPGELSRIGYADLPNREIYEEAGWVTVDGGFLPPSMAAQAAAEDEAEANDRITVDKKELTRAATEARWKVWRQIRPNLRLPPGMQNLEMEAFLDLLAEFRAGILAGTTKPEIGVLGSLLSLGSVKRSGRSFAKTLNALSATMGERRAYELVMRTMPDIYPQGPPSPQEKGQLMRPEILWAMLAGDTTDPIMMKMLVAIARPDAFRTQTAREAAIEAGVTELYRRIGAKDAEGLPIYGVNERGTPRLPAIHGRGEDPQKITGAARARPDPVTGEPVLQRAGRPWSRTEPRRWQELALAAAAVEGVAEPDSPYAGLEGEPLRMAIIGRLIKEHAAGIGPVKSRFASSMTAFPEYATLDTRMLRDVFGLSPKFVIPTIEEYEYLSAKLREIGSDSKHLYGHQWLPWEYLTGEKTTYTALIGIYQRVNAYMQRAEQRAAEQGVHLADVLDETSHEEQARLISFARPTETTARIGLAFRPAAVDPTAEGHEEVIQALEAGTAGVGALRKAFPELFNLLAESGLTLTNKIGVGLGGWRERTEAGETEYYLDRNFSLQVQGPRPAIRWFTAAMLQALPREKAAMLIYQGPGSVKRDYLGGLTVTGMSREDLETVTELLSEVFGDGWSITTKARTARRYTAKGQPADEREIERVGKGGEVLDVELFVGAITEYGGNGKDLRKQVTRMMRLLAERGYTPTRTDTTRAEMEFMDRAEAGEVVRGGPAGAQRYEGPILVRGYPRLAGRARHDARRRGAVLPGDRGGDGAIGSGRVASDDLSGGPALLDEAAPSALVSRAQALASGVPVEIPDDPDFLDALAKSGWQVTDEGIDSGVERHQKPELAGQPTLQSAAFYSAQGSQYADSYRGGQRFGGAQEIAGPTLFRRPFVARARPGGKLGEAVLKRFLSPEGPDTIDESMGVIWEKHAPREDKIAAVTNTLEEFGGDPSVAEAIVDAGLAPGNDVDVIAYSVRENIAANLLRANGYDSALGYLNEITEIIDAREIRHPIPGTPGFLHPMFEAAPSAMAARLPTGYQDISNAVLHRELLQNSPTLLAQAAESTARLHDALVRAIDSDPLMSPEDREVVEGFARFYTSAIIGLAANDQERLDTIGLTVVEAERERERAMDALQQGPDGNDGLTALYEAEAAWATLFPRYDPEAPPPSAMAGLAPTDWKEPFYSRLVQLADLLPDEVTPILTAPTEARIVRRATQARGAVPPASSGLAVDADGNWVKPASPGGTVRISAGDQVLAQLEEAGAKPDEIAWTGLKEWLAEQGERPISRDEVLAYLDQNRVVVEETVLEEPSVTEARNFAAYAREEYGYTDEEIDAAWDSLDAETGIYSDPAMQAWDAAWESDRQARLRRPRHGRYVLPGGQHYRELLLRLPAQEPSRSLASMEREMDRINDQLRILRAGRPMAEIVNDPEQLRAWAELGIQYDAVRQEYDNAVGGAWRSKDYRSGHWDGYPNVIVHVRFTERTDADGRRILFLEEVQGDWPQEGRDRGYRRDPRPHTPEEAARALEVANELVAIGNRYEELTDRWRQALYASDNVAADAIDAERLPVAARQRTLRDELLALDQIERGKGGVPDQPFKRTEQWAGLAFRRMIRWAAERGYGRIGWAPGEVHDARWPDPERNPEAFKNFYDDQLVKRANALGEPWGVRATISMIDLGGGRLQGIHALDLPAQMTRSALLEGQPLFMRSQAPNVPAPIFYSELERAAADLPEVVEPILHPPSEAVVVRRATQARGALPPASSGLEVDAEGNWVRPARAGGDVRTSAGDQIQALLEAAGVKADEVFWTGLQDWLAEREAAPITRDEVVDFLAENRVALREVYPEDQRYHQYTLPGGENYRELLLALNQPETVQDRVRVEEEAGGIYRVVEYDANGRFAGYVSGRYNQRAGAVAARERYLAEHWPESITRRPYTGPHWQVPNVLVHVRFNERTGPNGERILFIEEIQSDWHQAGATKGYGSFQFAPPEKQRQLTEAYEQARHDVGTLPYGTPEYREALTRMNGLLVELRENVPGWGRSPTDEVPDAPFKGAQNWSRLAMRRMIRWAAQNGFDQIAWTTGEQQAERYSLERRLSRIEWDEARATIAPYGLEGEALPLRRGATRERLAEFIPAGVAERFRAVEPDENGVRRLVGDELRGGGEGMQRYYDDLLVQVANKLGEAWGTQVGTTRIGADPRLAAGGVEWVWNENGEMVPSTDPSVVEGVEVHALALPEPMRESAVYEGQPLFMASQPPTEGAMPLWDQDNDPDQGLDPDYVQAMDDYAAGQEIDNPNGLPRTDGPDQIAQVLPAPTPPAQGAAPSRAVQVIRGVPSLGPVEDGEPDLEQFPEWAQLPLDLAQGYDPTAPPGSERGYPGTKAEVTDVATMVAQGPNAKNLNQRETEILIGAILGQYARLKKAIAKAAGPNATAWDTVQVVEHVRRYTALKGLATVPRERWALLSEVWTSAPITSGQGQAPDDEDGDTNLGAFVQQLRDAEVAGDEATVTRLREEAARRAALLVGPPSQRARRQRRGAAAVPRTEAVQAVRSYAEAVAAAAGAGWSSPSRLAEAVANPDLSIRRLEVLATFRYNNMLLGPRGILIDYATNTGMLFGKIFADPFLNLVETRGNLRALAGVQAAEYAALARAWPLALRAAHRQFMEGIGETEADIAGVPRSMSGRLSRRIANALDEGASSRGLRVNALRAGKVGAIAFGELAGRIKSVADVLIKELAWSMEQTRQAAILAYRQGRTEGFAVGSDQFHQRVADILQGKNLDPDTEKNTVLYQEMTRNSTREAERTVFQGEMGTLGRMMEPIQQHPLGMWVLPFLRTLYHIRGWAVDLSPVGAVGTTWDVARSLAARKIGATERGQAFLGRTRNLGGALGGPYATAWRGAEVGPGVADLDRRALANVVGTTTFFYLVGMALEGLLSAGGPPEEDIVWLEEDEPDFDRIRLRQTMQAQGWQQYSIRLPWFDGKTYWVSYSNWGPLSYLMGAAAVIGETYRYGIKAAPTPPGGTLERIGRGAGATGDILGRGWAGLNDWLTGQATPNAETFKSAGRRFVSTMADMSYLGGIKDLADVTETLYKLYVPTKAESPGEQIYRERRLEAEFKNWASYMLTSLIPGGALVNTIAQSQDPMARATEFGGWREAFALRIPELGYLPGLAPPGGVPTLFDDRWGSETGRRQGLAVRHDVLGREVANQYAGWRAWQPFRATAAELDNEVLNTLVDAGVGASSPPTELVWKPEGGRAIRVLLSQDQRQELAVEIGQATNARIQQELAAVSPEQRAADPAAWADRLKTAAYEAYSTAKKTYEAKPETQVVLSQLAQDPGRLRSLEAKKDVDLWLGRDGEAPSGGATTPSAPAPSAPAPAPAPRTQEIRDRNTAPRTAPAPAPAAPLPPAPIPIAPTPAPADRSRTIRDRNLVPAR